MDGICLSHRPRKGCSKPLKCLNDIIPSFDDLALTIWNLQLDNQMYRKGLYDFPAIVTGQEGNPLPKFKFNNCLVSDYILDTLKDNSLVSLQLTFDNNSDKEKNVLKFVHMKIKPLNLYIEDTFVYKLNQILNSFETFRKKTRLDCTSVCSKIPSDILISSQNLSRHLCLDTLKIDEISVLVNVHASLKMYIGLDQSPLHFALFERNNFITTSYALGT